MHNAQQAQRIRDNICAECVYGNMRVSIKAKKNMPLLLIMLCYLPRLREKKKLPSAAIHNKSTNKLIKAEAGKKIPRPFI